MCAHAPNAFSAKQRLRCFRRALVRRLRSSRTSRSIFCLFAPFARLARAYALANISVLFCECGIYFNASMIEFYAAPAIHTTVVHALMVDIMSVAAAIQVIKAPTVRSTFSVRFSRRKQKQQASLLFDALPYFIFSLFSGSESAGRSGSKNSIAAPTKREAPTASPSFEATKENKREK